MTVTVDGNSLSDLNSLGNANVYKKSYSIAVLCSCECFFKSEILILTNLCHVNRKEMFICSAGNVAYGATGSLNAYGSATVVYTVTTYKCACALCIAKNKLNVAYRAILKDTAGGSRTEVVTNDTADSGGRSVAICIFCGCGTLDHNTVNRVSDNIVFTSGSTNDTTNLTCTNNLNILNCGVKHAESITLAEVTYDTTYVVALFGRAVYTKNKAGACTVTDNRAVLNASIALTCKTTNRVFTGDLDIAGYVAVVYDTYRGFKLTYERTNANKTTNLSIVDSYVLDCICKAKETCIVTVDRNVKVADSIVITVEAAKELSRGASDRSPCFIIKIDICGKYNELIIEGSTCVNHITEDLKLIKA